MEFVLLMWLNILLLVGKFRVLEDKIEVAVLLVLLADPLTSEKNK
jgi:hypothetical protein